MTHEEVYEIIRKMQEDPRVVDLLKGYDPSEEEFKVYGEIAKKLGYVESADEFKKMLEERKNSIVKNTEDTIENIPDDDLKAVAGGKAGHKQCKDTYKDKENCWANDACDIVIHYYDRYQCHYASACDNHQQACGQTSKTF